MYSEEEKRPQALKNHHMLYAEAARIARKAGAGRLILTHFSTSLDDPEACLPEVRNIFEDIFAAHDGMTMLLRYPKEEEPAEMIPGEGWPGAGRTDVTLLE